MYSYIVMRLYFFFLKKKNESLLYNLPPRYVNAEALLFLTIKIFVIYKRTYIFLK